MIIEEDLLKYWAFMLLVYLIVRNQNTYSYVYRVLLLLFCASTNLAVLPLLSFALYIELISFRVVKTVLITYIMAK